ncbi:MAG: TetR/AcrR family transcriptional regulator [Actinomycetota bacterium]
MTVPLETGTASALLDAAEARFAADGFAGASLRGIMRDAETDPGSIHYHFGGRPELAVGVLDRILVPLNDHRVRLLDTAVAAGQPSAAALVRALVTPDVEIAAELDTRGPGRARLVRAIYLEPETFVLHHVERRFAPVAQRFAPHLANAIPDVAMAEIAWRVRWNVFPMVGAVLGDAAARTSGSDLPAGATHGQPLADRLVAAAVGALCAPTLATPPDRPRGEDHP